MKKTKRENYFLWQRGYGVFSMSKSQTMIVSNYIKNQTNHHKKISFEDELKLILKKCTTKYDEKYLWD